MLCGKGCEIVLFAVPGPDKKVVVPVNLSMRIFQSTRPRGARLCSPTFNLP